MKIAVVGSYGVAMTMRLNSFPAAGETVVAQSYEAVPGGKGSNQAIGAARLGAEVTLLTAVGADSFGEDALALWRRENVKADQVLTGTRPTMVGFVLVEQTGENRIAIAPGALDELTADHVERFRRAISEADILVVSMEIPMAAVCAALRIAAEEGTRALLNPAPAARLPAEAWDWIDVLTPNQTEAPLLLGLTADHGLTPEELIHQLRQRTSAAVILTLGADGSLISVGDDVMHVPAIRVPQVVDTTGAGDSFTAALAVDLAQNEPLETAALRASAAGAHAVTIAGVIPALPTTDDIDALIGHRR